MNEMDKWTYFLKCGDKLDEGEIPADLETPEIKKAVQELKKFSQDEVERELYESRLKAMKDKKWMLASEYKKGIRKGEKIGIEKGEKIGIEKGEKIGIEKGKQEGEKIGIEKMVVNALRKGVEVTTIVEWSGLSKKEIQAIKDKDGL